MAQGRFDLYRNVHKGLRAALYAAAFELGAADPTSCAGAAELAKKVLTLCRRHAEAENRFIHPAIDAVAPGAAAACTAAHDAHAAELADLESRLAVLTETAAEDGQAALADLYLDFSAFVGDNLLHMAEEERRLMPVLWRHCDDAALKDIQRQILQFLGPQVMQDFLRWMLPAMRPEEAAGLLGGIRLTAPAAGWSAIWNLAHSVLPPEKLHHLANRLGEAAPARELALLQIDFPFAGPWGDDLALALRGLAEAIAATPGLLWKIWTENPETGRAGGIYLFTGKADAEAYLDLHSKRLADFGIDGITARLFGVNEALGRINRAPLAT